MAKKNQAFGDMARHDAIGLLVNTAIQMKSEGFPLTVASHQGAIAILITGFDIDESGAIIVHQDEVEAAQP